MERRLRALGSLFFIRKTDKGYDMFGWYNTIAKRGAKAAIPPRSNAKIQQPHELAQGHPRDENLRRVNKVGRKHLRQPLHP